jgi:tellurium resistance protein TerD
MAIMKRGSNVALTREIPDLAQIVLGVTWNTGAEPVLEDNLVVATLLCDSSSKALSADHFVFFNQLSTPDMSVTELQRVLGGDKEQVEINLASVPPEVAHIVVILYLNPGTAPRRTLGQLRQLEVRVLNLTGNVELVRSENLAAGLSAETALVLADVYRYNGDWKFKVVGDGYASGIAGVASDYGLPL